MPSHETADRGTHEVADPGPLRLGMIGGGEGAFIGAVHRMAARLDGRCALVAGALSSDPQRARRSGLSLGLEPARSYGSWQEMLEREDQMRVGQRIEAVAIVTPNHAHAPQALACLRAGMHVICDKPLCTRVDDALELAREAGARGLVFAVTYIYSGYPMVRLARHIVRTGELGEVRRVIVEYHQGWLATPLERTGQKQALWRTDPALAGAGALGDIATHAEHLARFVTGLRLRSLCADVRAAVAGRRIDDDASILLRFEGGARGVLSASQVCAGKENDLRLRVFGERGSIEWRQEEPNRLELSTEAGLRVLRPAVAAPAAVPTGTRLPPGHPEAFIEAFATIYSEFAQAVRARAEGKPAAGDSLLPVVGDGVLGVWFVDRALHSAQHGAQRGASAAEAGDQAMPAWVDAGPDALAGRRA